MGLEFSLDDGSRQSPERPYKDTKERLKAKQWVNKERPGQIRGGIGDALRSLLHGKNDDEK